MNLLSKTEKDKIKIGFNLRFKMVFSVLVSFSFLVGLLMLLPTYIIFNNFSDENNQSLNTEDKNHINEILNFPAKLESKLMFFKTAITEPLVTEQLSKIIDSLPNGVKINSISFSQDRIVDNKNGIVILISGISANRDLLVNFVAKLKQDNSFSGVEVPVSNLTKDKNLPFSMNIFIEK